MSYEVLCVIFISVVVVNVIVKAIRTSNGGTPPSAGIPPAVVVRTTFEE